MVDTSYEVKPRCDEGTTAKLGLSLAVTNCRTLVVRQSDLGSLAAFITLRFLLNRMHWLSLCTTEYSSIHVHTDIKSFI